jgi:hypothetical protein
MAPFLGQAGSTTESRAFFVETKIISTQRMPRTYADRKRLVTATYRKTHGGPSKPGDPGGGGRTDNHSSEYRVAVLVLHLQLCQAAGSRRSVIMKASKMIPKAALIRMMERKVFNDEGYLGLWRFRLYLLSIYVEKKYGCYWDWCGCCCAGSGSGPP